MFAMSCYTGPRYKGIRNCMANRKHQLPDILYTTMRASVIYSSLNIPHITTVINCRERIGSYISYIFAMASVCSLSVANGNHCLGNNHWWHPLLRVTDVTWSEYVINALCLDCTWQAMARFNTLRHRIIIVCLVLKWYYCNITWTSRSLKSNASWTDKLNRDCSFRIQIQNIRISNASGKVRSPTDCLDWLYSNVWQNT